MSVECELRNFAAYSRSVASDTVGPRRLAWQERAEWAERLAAEAGWLSAENAELRAALERYRERTP
jgi:hypothetical protein